MVMLIGVPSLDPGVSLNQDFRKRTSMTTYRVDLAAGEVIEMAGNPPRTGDGREPGVGDDAALSRVQARLRTLSRRINGAPEGEEKARLREEYRRLQQRLRELGDADPKDHAPGDELTAAVDGLVADFSGAADRPDAGLEGFLNRIAENDSGELPENVREDAELQEALRAQTDEDHFEETEGDGLSDDEMWGQYRETLGMEEG